MHQDACSSSQESSSGSAVSQHISDLKMQLGTTCCIMAHHYQTDSIVQHADLTGDSLELARQVPQVEAKHIIFCGVHFMAESAGLLCRPGQQAYAPSPEAKCIMSAMAPSLRVETAIAKLNSTGRKVIPLAYVNSSAAVKAACGAADGTVCTSANAPKILSACLEKGDAVLFLPDKNLARNTADKLGISEQDRFMLDIRNQGAALDEAAQTMAKLFIWPGCCAVHHRFQLADVEKVRSEYPDTKIVSHPECSPEVIRASDADGSTSFIIKYIKAAPEGSRIAVGTELNLVLRMAERYAGSKNIVPLKESACSNMAKVTEEKLLAVLEGLCSGDPARQPQPITPAHELYYLERKVLNGPLQRGYRRLTPPVAWSFL